jgi:cell division septation protein DedD
MTDWITNLGVYKTTTEKAAAIGNLRNKVPNQMTALLNKMWHPISYYIIKPIKDFFWKFFDQPYQKTGENYKQFTGSFGTQKYLTLFSILILAFFLRKIFKEETINHLSEEEYWAYLNHKLGRENPEDEPGYVIDDTPVHYNGIQKQYPDRLENEDDDANTIDLSGGSDDVQTIDLSSDKEVSETKETTQNEEDEQGDLNRWVTVAGNTPEKPTTYSTKKTVKDGCSIVSKGKGWLIQDAYFKDGKLANTRLENLKHRGIDAFLVSKNCVDKGGVGYFVFIGDPILKEKTASIEKINYQKALKRYGLEKGTLLLRKL